MSRRARNILLILADQLAQKAVGAYGDPYSHTPNIDRLAAAGVRFENVYTTCPLCGPARASLWTGLLPHTVGVVSNGRQWPMPEVSDDIPTLGAVFSEAGYQTLHFGKRHDSSSLRGFRCDEEGELPVEGNSAWPVDYDTKNDAFTTKRCVEYLRKPHDSPFLMVADIQNPHDICNWVGSFAGPHEDVAPPGVLPELPENFEVENWDSLPLPIQYICCSHNRLSQAARWSESNYRHYLAAYYHFVSRADASIGEILAALEASDSADDTLVVFLVDHGDGMTSHRMVTKQVSFYEETTRVPLVFAGPGVDGPGRAISQPLASLLDILPTLCDYAGLRCPQGLAGESLLPWIEGRAPDNWRDYVASEWVTEWGFTVEPGRMIRTRKYKYTRYLEGEGEELYDLQNDPGERKNLSRLPAHSEALAEHRRILEDHIKATGDPFYSLPVKAEKRWRSHEVGYQNHRGPAAPMV